MAKASWADRVEEHRHRVREGILDATARVVAENGLDAVTMGRIAEAAGLGRARLHRYFPDVDSVLRAWHERQLGNHLGYLDQTRQAAGDPLERLAAVLRSFAAITHQSHEHHVTERGAALHGGEHLAHARQRLHGMVADLIAEAARDGQVRTDIPARQLAGQCLHALAAADDDLTADAIRKLVARTLAELRQP